MEPGIYQLSNKEYHEGPGISSSGWWSLAKSPEYYQWRKNNPSEPSQAMLDGTQFHTAVLEPARYNSEYIAAPGGIDRRTKAGKEAWAYFESISVGKCIVTQEKMDMVTGMVASLAKSETATALLSDGVAEQSIFWEDPLGFLCKCRPDFLAPKHKTVAELKSTADVSPRALQNTIERYRYHWQQFYYMNGLYSVFPDEYEDFVFIFVETKPPYTVVTRILETDWLIAAELQMQPLKEQYKKCLDLDVWPGLPDEIGVIKTPKWLINNIIFD